MSVKNTVLIGMPGVGKSTIGVLLAKALSWDFLDTDVYIQSQEHRQLNEIIAQEGSDRFCEIEEQYLQQIDCHHCVIATGGSAIYGAAAMQHLKKDSITVGLSLSLPLLEGRLEDLSLRGVVISKGQSFEELYEERLPYYQEYADLWINCDALTQEQIVKDIKSALKQLEEWDSK